MISIAVENGVNMVQVRAPDLGEGDFDRLVVCVVDAVEGQALSIVNPSRRQISDYPNVDGYQISENATVTVAQIRDTWGDTKLVGRSVHTLDSALRAAATGIDFLVLGTIFSSASHPGGTAHGTGIIRQVAEKTHVPVIGIGGISKGNAGETMAIGARGVAVVRSILGTDDPASATCELLDTMIEGLAAHS